MQNSFWRRIVKVLKVLRGLSGAAEITGEKK